MKDALGHGSNPHGGAQASTPRIGQAAAHQAAVESTLAQARRATDEELVEISRLQREAIARTHARMAAEQHGEAAE